MTEQKLRRDPTPEEDWNTQRRSPGALSRPEGRLLLDLDRRLRAVEESLRPLPNDGITVTPGFDPGPPHPSVWRDVWEEVGNTAGLEPPPIDKTPAKKPVRYRVRMTKIDPDTKPAEPKPTPKFLPGQWVCDAMEGAVGICQESENNDPQTQWVKWLTGSRAVYLAWEHPDNLRLATPDAELVFPKGIWPDMKVRVCENPVDGNNAPRTNTLDARMSGQVGTIDEVPRRAEGGVFCWVNIGGWVRPVLAHNLRPAEGE